MAIETPSATKRNVPVFILAGGMGTRISEETHLKPKPMIEVGDIPVLLHIMRWYYSHGFDDFVICAGYRAWEIKSYFLNYEFRVNHLAIDHRASADQAAYAMGRNAAQEKWRIRVIDTGLECMTGGRVARAFDLVAAEGDRFDDFAVTYGDGLSDVDLTKELQFHRSHGKSGTVLGVVPSARWGELDTTAAGQVQGFLEKPESRAATVNGGFFFLKRDFRKYLDLDGSCVLERDPLEKLAQDGQMMMFRHTGFWHPMDTLRDKTYLQGLWDSGRAPWMPKAAASARPTASWGAASEVTAQ